MNNNKKNFIKNHFNILNNVLNSNTDDEYSNKFLSSHYKLTNDLLISKDDLPNKLLFIENHYKLLNICLFFDEKLPIRNLKLDLKDSKLDIKKLKLLNPNLSNSNELNNDTDEETDEETDDEDKIKEKIKEIDKELYKEQKKCLEENSKEAKLHLNFFKEQIKEFDDNEQLKIIKVQIKTFEQVIEQIDVSQLPKYEGAGYIYQNEELIKNKNEQIEVINQLINSFKINLNVQNTEQLEIINEEVSKVNEKPIIIKNKTVYKTKKQLEKEDNETFENRFSNNNLKDSNLYKE